MTTTFKRFYPRVNTRITAPFLLMTVVVAGLGVFIVTQLVSSSIAERLNNQLLSSAQAAANATVEIETEQLAALRALVFTEGMPQAIADNNVEAIAQRLSPLVLNNQLDSVIVYDSAATPIYSLGYERFSGTLVANPMPEDTVIAGIERVLQLEVDTLGDKFVDVVPVDDDTMFFITAPVVDERNFIVGGVAIGLRASNLLRRLTEQALANLIIYDQSGTIVATSFRNNLDGLRLSEDDLAQIEQILVTSSPYRELTLNELSYRALYSPFEFRSEPIGLISVALPTDFVIEQIGVSRNAFLVLFGGLFFVVIVIGLLVTRSIVQPINKLVDTTRAIQDGDLSRRVGLNQPDEIGELSSSFDKMTERLVARNDEVQDLYARQVEETARRDAILSSITDAVVVRDGRGEIVMMNPAARSLLAELERDNPDSLQQFLAVQWQHDMQVGSRALSVDDRHYSTVATPIYTDDNEILGSIIVYRDISRLVEAERLKDEMILQLSHELRTPLSSVRGYVELLQLMNAPVLDQQSSAFLVKAIEQLTVLERMVNQVIDVSAVLAEDIEPEIEIFDLVGVLEGAVAKHQAAARERYQRLSVYYPPNAMPIDGDPQLIGDVIEHMIRNAISYTQEAGHITVSLDYVDSRMIEIVVIDNGVGIAADELPYVFERLYRGRSADAGVTDARGLGLGLFMSREIVEAHHGEILIDSQPDKGTIVTIHLPIKHAERVR